MSPVCACGRAFEPTDRFCTNCGRPALAPWRAPTAGAAPSAPGDAPGVMAPPASGDTVPAASVAGPAPEPSADGAGGPSRWAPGGWEAVPPDWHPPAWAGPRSTAPAPVARPRRRAAMAAAVCVAGLAVVTGGAFAVTQRVAGVSGDVARYRPAPLDTPTPSATPVSLAQVASAALSRVVTIEVQTDRGEEFGTGWLFDRKGDFVTNDHVIEGRRGVRILDRRNVTHDAVVMGYDRAQDIAVVRSLDGFSGDPLPLARTGTPPVPQDVVVLASSRATGEGDTTNETLVRLGQSVPVQGDSTDVIPGQATSVTYDDMMVLRGNRIYKGNSGGPVLDAYSRVIGIVTLASQSTPQAFAIPITRVVDELAAFAARPSPSG